MIEKSRRPLLAHLSAVEGMDIAAQGRVSPDGGRQHEGYRFAGAGIHAPQMDEEGEGTYQGQNRGGKGGGQHNPCRHRLPAAVHGRFVPGRRSPTGFHRIVEVPKGGIPIKYQPIHIGGKPFPRYVSQPSDGLLLRDDVVVQILHVVDVVHQRRSAVAGDGDSLAGKRGDVPGGGNGGFVHNGGAPFPLPARRLECQRQLHLPGVDIHQTAHRHNRVGAGTFPAAVGQIPENTPVQRFPGAAAQLHGLAVKLGLIGNHVPPFGFQLRLVVLLQHPPEALEAHSPGVFLHLDFGHLIEERGTAELI